MGTALRQRLDPVRRRQQQLRALSCAALGLFVSAIALLICVFLRWLTLWQPPAGLSAALAVALPAVGYIAGALWPRDWRDAAVAVDLHYDFKDRILTALEFLSKPDATRVHRLAVDDAMQHLDRVDARQVVPCDTPRILPCAIASLAAAVVLFVFTSPALTSVSAEEPLAAAIESADRAADELRSLEEFARDEQDPEIEKLVNELKQAIDELKQPGVDMREALAKLSEMQAVLEQQQAKHSSGQVDAHLQAVGQALSLAESLAEAGNALSSKQYEKAAEELEKLELPKLDRQTEKAIKEKLDGLARQMTDSGSSSLSAAAGELSKGLGGDGRRFKRGLVQLARVARNQNKRNKLVDLLKKQNECLCECKELKWGRAASGNKLGESTEKFGGHYETRLTGRQSDQGEIETETTHSPEGKQQAHREYKAKYEKYRKISEAVLDSEPIPLGHRQTIRRYFEAIRPTDAQTDAVQSATK